MKIMEYVGNTPFLHLKHISKKMGAQLYVKLESCNPGGSLKDRVAKAYLNKAIQQGELDRGGCVVEATEGSLGLSLAMCCAALDVRLMLCMPAYVGRNCVNLLRAMEVNVTLTAPEEGMTGAIAQAEFMHDDIWGSFRPNPYKNPVGPQAHYDTTGAELVAECEKYGIRPDIFVMGVGSGATLTGVGRRLRKSYPDILLAAVEPQESPVLSGGQASLHTIAGLGPGFVPEVLDCSIINEIIPVSADDAIRAARRLMGLEGVKGGLSSGANVHAALMLAQRPEFQGANIITLVCDSSERYLTTKLFMDNYR